MKKSKRLYPLLLTLFIVATDQLTKNWIVSHIPVNTVGYSFFGGFLDIVHVRNNAVAFSLGSSLSLAMRTALFIVLPLLVLAYIGYLVVSTRNNDLSSFYRWIFAAFLGGGIGNVFDRIFRHFQVVDFMQNRVYGLFGLEYWPVWNFADASIVIAGTLFILHVLYHLMKDKENK